MHLHTIIVPITLTAAVAFGASATARAEQAQPGLFVVGQAARLEPGRDVEAAVVIGGDLTIEGHVAGVAAAIGGDLHVVRGARVDGPVVALGGTLEVDEGADLRGPRATVAPGDFSQVASDLAKVDFDREEPTVWSGAAMRVAQIVSLLVIGLLLVWLAPRYVQGVRQTLQQQSGVAVLVGVLVMVGLVPLCLLLAVSLVGIPLIPLAIAAVLAACTLGLVALAATLGHATRLIKKPDNLLGAMALGLAILGVGVAVPFFGSIVMFVASACGAGAALLSRFGARPPMPPAPDEPARGVKTQTTAAAGG